MSAPAINAIPRCSASSHGTRVLTILLAAAFVLAAAGPARAQVQGTTTTYQSPNAVEERCVAATPIPGGAYSDGDRAEEARLCSIDLWAPTVALCPKTWSTSPGTLVYDVSSGEYANDRARFEREACARGGRAIRSSAGELAKHKQSVNTVESSATFSASSLLYYHLSRYFETTVNVPVSVFRSIDREAHLEHVTEAGLRFTSGKKSLGMIHAGWQALRDGERNPGSYSPTDELFTPDRSSIYGILILTSGERYGSEINGTRESGWGSGQNRDFQNTAAYLALRSEKPLAAAIEEGLAEARLNPKLDHDLGPDVSDVQMVYWMQELTEIVLLDFIFSQQDRIGNIDYTLAWTWVEDGRVRSRDATGTEMPADLADASPILLKRTWINDNDAGVRTTYTDFAEKTHMVEKLRHMSPDTYRKLIALDSDFSSAGPLYAYLRDTFGLTSSQLGAIVRHTAHAAATLRESCRAGDLRFDLDPEQFLVDGTTPETDLSCEAP